MLYILFHIIIFFIFEENIYQGMHKLLCTVLNAQYNIPNIKFLKIKIPF